MYHNVIIEVTFFGLLLETGPQLLQCMWSSESHEGLAGWKAKSVPTFLLYFKNLSGGVKASRNP